MLLEYIYGTPNGKFYMHAFCVCCITTTFEITVFMPPPPTPRLRFFTTISDMLRFNRI